MITILPEVQKINEFSTIIKRDKDKAKRNAHNELAFIYFWANYQSPYLNYTEPKREALLRKDLRLGDEWVFDSDIKKGIQKYKELNETLTIRILCTMKDALVTTMEVIENMRKKIESTLTKIQEDDMGEGTEDLLNLIQSVTALITLSEKIPKSISILEALEEKSKKESSDTKIYGGGKAGLFED
jgi:hypothetical protein